MRKEQADFIERLALNSTRTERVLERTGGFQVSSSKLGKSLVKGTLRRRQLNPVFVARCAFGKKFDDKAHPLKRVFNDGVGGKGKVPCKSTIRACDFSVYRYPAKINNIFTVRNVRVAPTLNYNQCRN